MMHRELFTVFDNFNPEKSNNPFAYFTQIIYYALFEEYRKKKTSNNKTKVNNGS